MMSMSEVGAETPPDRKRVAGTPLVCTGVVGTPIVYMVVAETLPIRVGKVETPHNCAGKTEMLSVMS